MTDRAGSDRPKAKSLRPLRTLWPFITPYYPTLIAALTALLDAHDDDQETPIWPSVLSSPIAIDHTQEHPVLATDKYIYWQN